MKKLLLTLIFLFVVGFSISYAQPTTTLTSAVGANISPLMDIGSDGSTARSFVFDTATKLKDGITLNNAFTVNTKSNIPFKVTVTAPNANFTYTGSESGTLSVDKLMYKIVSEGSTLIDYTPLDFTGADIFTSTRGTKSFTVDYRMEPGFDAAPGAYDIVLTYTISAQ